MKTSTYSQGKYVESKCEILFWKIFLKKIYNFSIVIIRGGGERRNCPSVRHRESPSAARLPADTYHQRTLSIIREIARQTQFHTGPRNAVGRELNL